MILIVTLPDGECGMVNTENVCTITPPLSGDPPTANTVFTMSNGYRQAVREKIVDIAHSLGSDCKRV